MKARSPRGRLAGLLLLAVVPLAASAHPGADGGLHDGFALGFLHPFTGLDHLVAIGTAGAWAALAAPAGAWPARLAAPLAFVLTMLAGALAAAAGLAPPAVEPMIAASLLVLGVLLALRQRLPVAAAAAIVALFALFHGAAHGRELAGGAALAGMGLATGLLLAAGAAVGPWLRARGRWWSALAGAGSAAFGAALWLIG